MKYYFGLTLTMALLFAPRILGQEKSPPLATNLKNPQSIAVGGDGRIFVTIAPELGKESSGKILALKDGKVSTFYSGLKNPKGISSFQQWLIVVDGSTVLKIDLRGKSRQIASSRNFPIAPINLSDVVIDPESGTIYIADSGDAKGKGAAIFRISPQGGITVVTSQKRWPNLQQPTALAMDGASNLLVLDGGTGILSRLRLSDGSHEKLAEGLKGGAGIAWDMHGQLFFSGGKNRTIQGIPRPGKGPVSLPAKFKLPTDITYFPKEQSLLVVDRELGSVTMISPDIPGYEVDKSPMALQTALAFPKVKWSGWSPESNTGLLQSFRPIVLTHAGDGSNRIFVATQRGVIHFFGNDPKVEKTTVFLDIEKRVAYNDNQNEEGFLGLAFHPDFKKNGEFFVFYTPRSSRLVNVLSRFRVSKEDPTKADPQSEEILLKIKRPFWNHDGGTIAFGPDGYLYIAVGDGGAANDPYNNAQNLKTILGNILRIDVNRKEGGKNYAIPKDNPYVDRKDAAPEIYANGLRNVWRLAFDRQTGKLWAADVGQNLYEEINLIKKGGNHGWRLREAYHPFGGQGVGPRPNLIDPIWEYHHDVGKSITGGFVYRGKAFPELVGHYLYADYVSGKIWALRYDETTKRVVANRPIQDRSLPIMSFGEDEEGEAYLLTYSNTGQGIYRFSRKE